MLCPRCGYYAEKEDTVCPECGEILNSGTDMPYSGAEAIRQGKRARQAIHEAAERTLEVKRRRRSGASRALLARLLFLLWFLKEFLRLRPYLSIHPESSLQGFLLCIVKLKSQFIFHFTQFGPF